MKKTMWKRILSIMLTVALVFGTIGFIGEWNVKAAEIPEITMQLTGAPTSVSNWYFERTELSSEYAGTGWSDTKRYCFEGYKDGSTTPEMMWIEFIEYRTYIYGGANFVDGVVPTSSFHIPADSELAECTRNDADGSLTLVTGGKKVRLTHDLTIVKVDGVWMQKPTGEGVGTEPTLINGSYDSSNKAYALNIWVPNVTNLESIGTVNGTIQVNGVDTTAKWSGSNNPGYYQILVPCSAFPYGSSTSTNANMQGSAYVTIPANTTVGNMTFAEDMYVKICCDSMADGEYLIEQVESLPKDGYYLGSWNYNANEFRIQFRPVTAHTDTANTSPTRTIYINGQAVTLNCYDDLPYQFRVPWARLGGTSLGTIGTNIVRVPAMTLGDMTLTEDVWLKIDSTVKEELIPTTMTVGEGSTYNDTDKQYVIKFKPNDTRKVWTPGVSTLDLSVDGTTVTGAVTSWSNESDCFVAYVPYSAIEADATSASQIGSHLVTLTKGSYVGNRLLEEDVTVAVNGTSVGSIVTVALGTGSGGQDNNSRYVVWIVPSDGTIDTSLVGKSTIIYVDGEQKSATWAWYGEKSYALGIPYSALESNATSCAEIGSHIVKLPAGTDLAGYITGNDLFFCIDGENVKTCEPVLSSGSYDSSNKAYALNIWAPNITEQDNIGTVNGTIQVNGVDVTAKWMKSNTLGCYQVLVPCSAFPYGSSTSTNANMQGSAYVTIPANTTVGNMTFAEDMYVKICCDSMADGEYLIEQVESLPKDGYFFASWNYSSTEFRIQFRPVTAHTDTQNTSPTRTIYINGKAETFNCYDDIPYQFRVPHSKLGGTAYDNIATNIVRVPAMTLGDMTLTEDVWLKIDKTVKEELIPTTFSVGEGSTYNDTDKQYVIKFKPNDARKVWNPGVSTMDLSIDGATVTGAVASWSNEEDCFVAYVPYSAIEADATSASQMGSHLVTLPKGSYVGNRLLEEDVTVAINGTTIASDVKVSLGTDSGFQDNNKRYVVWVVPSDGVIDTSIIGKSTTIYVDDEAKSASWTWYGSSSYALEVPYNSLKEGATTYTEVGTRVVKLPAGTDLGGRLTGNDLYFRIQGENVNQCEPVGMSFFGNGNSSHFVISFTPIDGRTPVTPVNPDRTLWIDGKEVPNAVYEWYIDGAVYKMVLKFYTLESGATHYNQLSPHCVVVPKGTYVGDVLFKEDVYFKAYNSYGPVEITNKFAMKYASSAVETEGYRISLDVSGIADASTLAGASPILYVDGTETKDATISYEAKDTDTIDLVLPYNVVKAGATSAEDITQPYVITIPKRILFNDAALTESVSFVVNGSKVTGVIDTTMTVSLDAHDSNSTSGPSTLKFTTSPSDFLSVGASYDFLTGGIAVDGTVKSELKLQKEADGVYSIDLSDSNVMNGTVVAIDGTVQDGTSGVVFERICFRYRINDGWSVYEEPIVTKVTLSNDTINGERNLQGICINATSDPLANGDYQQSGFVFEDNDGEVRRHGGIRVNGEYPENVKLTKKWDGYWYIDLSGMIGSLKKGSVITLSGILCVGKDHVVFSEISYIYNKDGSFSQCDGVVEMVPNKTVTLPEVWVNINKYPGFDIQSAPLQQGASVELKVDGETTTESTLIFPGNYEVTRVVENAVKAEVVGGQAEYITYEQKVHLYETGDANGDGAVGVKDIVHQMRNEGATGNLIKSGSDLNGDGVMDKKDRKILVDLFLEKTTPWDVFDACEDVVIGAISDMHYLANGRDGQNRINTIKALNYYKSQNVDVIIFNADITDLGEVGAYQELVEDIKLVYPNEETRPTMIFTGDNHEWYDVWTVNGHTPIPGETFYTLQDRFNTQLSELRGGLEDSNSYYVVDGYHVIGVSSDGMEGGYSTYDEDTLTWLEETLETAAAEDANKPIFLAIHQAPTNTVVGSADSHYYSAELDTILEKYPQLVIITSHTHASVEDERSIYQGAYTVLNTASLYYVGSVKGSMDNTGLMSEKYQFAQGLLIRANGNTVDVERCDFYNDTKIKDNWKFTAGDNTVYTEQRAEQSQAPAFADDASTTVEWKDSTTARLTFDAVTEKKSAVSYTVDVYLDGYTTPVKTKTISSLYWCGEDAIPNSYTVEIEGLAKNKNYEFYITASNNWGVNSEALVVYHDGLDTEGHGPIDVDELLTLNHGITLRTDENGDFKVLVLSDVQSNSAVLEEDIQENIRMMVDKEDPDLVVFGGDNSYGMDTPEKLRSYLDSMVGYIEEKQIPWAHVYGNHDDQNEGDLVAMLNEEQQPIYEEYEYCVSKAGDPGVFGVGNFVLPVLNHDNDKIAFNVWGLDTGSYLQERIPDLYLHGNRNYGHYEYIQRSQIEWYSDASKALQEYNDGELIPGMMFFHIPLMENSYAWSIKESEGLEYSGQVDGGMASAAVNKGLFSKAVERGDIKVIVSAHDHKNDYMVKYQGIRLCGSSTVGTVNEFDPTILGGRVVTYSASAEEKVQTEMSYLYTEIPEPSTAETTKVTITGVDADKTSLGATSNIYLKTDVTGTVGTTITDSKAQVHHYQPADEAAYGIKTDIGWTAQGELCVQSKAGIVSGDVIILPKGMTFEIGGVTYELASTYRLTSNGTSLGGATGADPIKINLNGFNGWNKNQCTYYLTTDYNYTGKTWKMFYDNGGNLYYGATPVMTGMAFTGDSNLYVQNGCAHILDGTVVTVPKGFKFTICGVLFEVEETAEFICEGGNLRVK